MYSWGIIYTYMLRGGSGWKFCMLFCCWSTCSICSNCHFINWPTDSIVKECKFRNMLFVQLTCFKKVVGDLAQARLLTLCNICKIHRGGHNVLDWNYCPTVSQVATILSQSYINMHKHRQAVPDRYKSSLICIETMLVLVAHSWTISAINSSMM